VGNTSPHNATNADVRLKERDYSESHLKRIVADDGVSSWYILGLGGDTERGYP
jgi:hypothetical protein